MAKKNAFFKPVPKKVLQTLDMKNNSWEDEDSDLSPHSDEIDVSSPEFLETDEQGGVTILDDLDGEDEDEEEENEEDENPKTEGYAEEWVDEKDEAEDGIEDDVSEEGRLKRKRNEDKDLDMLRKALLAMKKTGFSTLDDESDISGSEDEDEDKTRPAKKKARSSKHAPTMQSSKHPVSRKRNVIPLAKSHARDPRFDPIAETENTTQIRKNYAFLEDYVDSEIKNLKARIKEQKPRKIRTDEGKVKTKRAKGVPKLSEEDIEAIKRQLTKLESKRATQKAKDQEIEVRKEHKKRESELVKQGKKPYFLKKSDVKKQVLVKKFEGMSQGKRDRAMEKKRRKMTAKDRRDMPFVRRIA